MTLDRLTIASIVASLLLACTSGQAQNPARACIADAQRLCSDALGNRDAVRQCMRDKRQQLSPDCRAAIKQRMEQKAGQPNGAPGRSAAGGTEISYGSDPDQRFDFYPATGVNGRSGENAPLIVFLHGGGWSIGDKAQAAHAKPAHYTANGVAFASVNYRLVPKATVEQQAADIAAAIALIRAEAKEFGVDPDRIALMGHSAGAHLAALVATDPRYLTKAGVPIAAVHAVVLLDGAGYDVQRQMAGQNAIAKRFYGPAFGNDPARQTALSPITHAGAPNAAAFLLIHAGSRAASREQAVALAARLRAAGTEAVVAAMPEHNHMTLNRELGVAGDPATVAVDSFLTRTL